uniref:adhesion G-protein coupled receptor G7 n=1 Tax=Scatophagus argus TaxID=75038 RepID=UPI001ED84229|nr:adhesion G-protein coupled receptor G7 [Scatophagus argus]
MNGGMLESGVCVCPDEWTGQTCSVENFCRAQKLDGFSFPLTPIGWFAYSKEVCPEGTSGASKPQASIRCSTKNGSPSFERPPRVLQCDQTLSDIQQNLTSTADLETLAASTQILTSNPEELTSENITTAAQIVNTLLLSPNTTEDIRVAAVATVSQLLSANTSDNGQENSATLGLTVTLDQLSVDPSITISTSQYQVVQPNLVVQSAQIPAADTQGVQFTSVAGTSSSFVASRIQLNTNTSTVVVENGFIADALIYVQFPAAAVRGRQEASNVTLGFVLYQNNHFFRSRSYKGQRANIRVLSGSVKGQELSVVPQHVEMLFRPTVLNGTSLHDFACVFWDYTVEDWSTDGCSKGNASDGLLRCFCNHTTNFAALWSFREKYEYAEALDWISIIGLSLSILGLTVTIIFHITSLRKESWKNFKFVNTAQLCICFSLLAFTIAFVTGVENSSRQDHTVSEVRTPNIIPQDDEHVDPDRGSCSAVAALLHFFLLATFMWISIYGIQAVLLTRDRHRLPSYWWILSQTVGWGVPAVVMAITLGVAYRVDDPLGYRQEEFCWLAALDKSKEFHFGKPMFWGFLLPFGLILICNVVLFVISCREFNNLNNWKNIINAVSLVALFGLSWLLGYLMLVTTGPTHLALSIVFCLCTATQGLQIFIFFTARKPDFRAAVCHTAQYVSSVHIHINRKYMLWKNSWSPTSSEIKQDPRDQQQPDIKLMNL